MIVKLSVSPPRFYSRAPIFIIIYICLNNYTFLILVPYVFIIFANTDDQSVFGNQKFQSMAV